MTNSNIIQLAKKQVAELTQAAYLKASEAGVLPSGHTISGVVEIPKDVSHGDFASSFSMVGAKAMGMNPRAIATAITEHIDLEGSLFAFVSIAGAGFLNFTLAPVFYAMVLSAMEEMGEEYGTAPEKNGKSVMIEFVSANPTGPMHMGNARGGVLGDTLANIMDKAGWRAHKEFYVNDFGNQIEKFALSIEGRYRQLVDKTDGSEFPAECYQGADITALAQLLIEQEGVRLLNLSEATRRKKFAEFGLAINIPKMKSDLERYGITYNQWFFESSLYEYARTEETLLLLDQAGATYEKEGALWLKTAELLANKLRKEGKTEAQIEALELKDDVLRRANGIYTYLTGDIAYHRNKLGVRNFDLAINVWGADHHGHVARMQVALDALGLNGSERLVVVLMQLVNLLQDGKPVRMSKRTGNAIALGDLLDEISVDSARFFFNNRVSTSSLDFDLDLAVRQDSENPVYYVQYAHARICSLIERITADGIAIPDASSIMISSILSPEESALIKTLAHYPEEISLAALQYDPSRINRYLTTLAGDFHRFYTNHHLLGSDPVLLQARLKLVDSTRQVLKLGLELLGVSAPDHM
ncbi:MAG: arginine--tRNA ligase [Eubacteriales bacterium]